MGIRDQTPSNTKFIVGNVWAALIVVLTATLGYSYSTATDSPTHGDVVPADVLKEVQRVRDEVMKLQGMATARATENAQQDTRIKDLENKYAELKSEVDEERGRRRGARSRSH